MNEILLPNLCSCHVIDPQKIRVLLWKRVKPNIPDTYLLKIAEQRFIGLIRTDKKGEVYWKFRNFAEEDNKLEKTVEKELNPVEKFQARQEKVQLKENDANSNHNSTEININS